jgi:glycosyltransferase involved in cell wall biosynthesis
LSPCATPTRVTAVSAELPWSPSLQVRVVGPGPALEAHGVALSVLTLLTRSAARRYEAGGLALRARLAIPARRELRRALARPDDDFDACLVHRRADLLPSLSLERAAADGRRLVYDVDDAIWLDARRDTGAHLLAPLQGSARKAAWLASRADHVIAGNAVLAEHLSRFSRTVSVIPSLVDTDRVPVRQHADAGELVVGWIGSRSTAPFLEGVRDVLERVRATLPAGRLRLLTVGGAMDRLPGIACEAHPWSARAQANALARIDVGVMPLPDTAWNRGKCAYKALQCMAAGIPVVADDVGVAGTVVGDAGRVVRGQPAWVEALVELLRDRALRERLGRRGRARVERDFSLARWAPGLAAVLRGDGSLTTPGGAGTPPG